MFTPAEERWLRAHKKPEQVQKLLDELPYRNESEHLPAVRALRDRRAHCFDGALLAAAMLRRAGIQPYIVDLCAKDDDDHLLCAYSRDGRWGAVAKSNFPGLRFREPLFRSARELVLSYFEFYFSLTGRKSLRRYSLPIRLPDIAKLNWELSAEGAEALLEKIESAPHRDLLGKAQIRLLAPVDERLFRSQMLGVSLKGAYGGAAFARSRRSKG